VGKPAPTGALQEFFPFLRHKERYLIFIIPHQRFIDEGRGQIWPGLRELLPGGQSPGLQGHATDHSGMAFAIEVRQELADLATMFDPILTGWQQCYGRFYGSAMSDAGVEPSVSSVGDSYDHALAEDHQPMVIWRRGPWRNFEAVEGDG
jgi:hypothetical protein